MAKAKNPGGYVIGLCGRSGSGKTTICKAFEKLGVASIDTDMVYHDMIKATEDGMPSALVLDLAREFGGNVVASDGSLNRAVLAGIVFADGNRDKLQRLSEITHGPILARTAEMITEYFTNGIKAVIVDAPALFESGFDKKCDAIVCLSAPDEILIKRIMARDSISEEAAKSRLSSMISDDELRSKCDHVIENTGENDLTAEAKAVLEKILD